MIPKFNQYLETNIYFVNDDPKFIVPLPSNRTVGFRTELHKYEKGLRKQYGKIKVLSVTNDDPILRQYKNKTSCQLKSLT